MTGYNVEISSTNDRDILNVGLWMTDQGKLVHAGLFAVKSKNQNGWYGVDIGFGYLAPRYRLWPFAELGIKAGAGSGISNLHGELYPKIGIAVPLSGQLLVSIGYLYSFSTEGRRSDYSAASVGFVWAI